MILLLIASGFLRRIVRLLHCVINRTFLYCSTDRGGVAIIYNIIYHHYAMLCVCTFQVCMLMIRVIVTGLQAISS